MHEFLDRVTHEIVAFHDAIQATPITPTATAREIRDHLADRYGDFAGAIPPADLVDDVTRMMRDWNLHVTHPRYYGLFNPSVQPAAVAGDLLVAGFNPQLAAWSHAPAANEIERYTLRFFAAQLGLDPETSAACFATGGAEANQSAVQVALTHVVPEYADHGLVGLAQAPVIYVSSESHHSFEKIAHGVGVGRDALRYVSVDAALRLDLDALRARIRADREAKLWPCLVVATAGTTGAGVVDPLPELADICRAEEMWFHVDAAWGGAACLSPTLRPVLAGIERADSITWDAHKWLSVPMGAGMFFCAHPDAVDRTFGVATPYMPHKIEETSDPYRTTIQWSRRHIGLKVFMSLAALGAEGYRRAIEHQARMADVLREELGARGWRVVNETPLPLVCFTHPAIESGTVPVADVVKELLARNFWVSEVRLGEFDPVLRACVTSYRTEPADVAALAAAATEIVEVPGAL